MTYEEWAETRINTDNATEIGRTDMHPRTIALLAVDLGPEAATKAWHKYEPFTEEDARYAIEWCRREDASLVVSHDRPDLDAIELATCLATGGPWHLDGATVMADEGTDIAGGSIRDPEEQRCFDLLASARTTIPVLIAYARRLEAEITSLKGAP